MLGEAFGESWTRDVLRGEPGRICLRIRVNDRCGVEAADAAYDVDLSGEPLPQFRQPGDVLMDHLHCNTATAEGAGEVDETHPALTKKPLNCVRSYLLDGFLPLSAPSDCAYQEDRPDRDLRGRAVFPRRCPVTVHFQ